MPRELAETVIGSRHARWPADCMRRVANICNNILMNQNNITLSWGEVAAAFQPEDPNLDHIIKLPEERPARQYITYWCDPSRINPVVSYRLSEALKVLAHIFESCGRDPHLCLDFMHLNDDIMALEERGM